MHRLHKTGLLVATLALGITITPAKAEDVKVTSGGKVRKTKTVDAVHS